MALGGGDRDREHDLDVVERLPRPGHEAELDVEDDLAGDQQVVVERQGVLREVDDALDRVLDRHDAAVDLAAGDGVEHVGHGRVGDGLGGGEVGLRPQRLLGERAERPEEPDRRVGGTRRDMASQAIGAAGCAPGRFGPASGSMGAWTKRRCGRCSTTSPPAASSPTTPSPGCAGCRSPTSATRSSTTTASCARACPRRSTGPGKTPEQCARIVGELLANGTGPVLLTRADDDQVKAVEAAHGPAIVHGRDAAVPAAAADARRPTCSS